MPVMPVRLFGLAIASALLAACSTADLPGFADAAVHATTGVNPQERLERRMNTNLRAAELEAERQAALDALEEDTIDPTEDSRSLASLLRMYADWSVMLVAADFRTAEGNPTDAFDNARGAMAQHLMPLGFQQSNMTQLSVRPERYDDADLDFASFENIHFGLQTTRQQAEDGCFVYLTSHGSPIGIAMGETGFMTPGQLNEILNTQCTGSPTILIVSACYSGAFASGDMLQPNRMIMTAARSDRTSFGCGEDDRYPYFDACLFQSFPQSADWMDFARRTLSCVETRERAENLSPPSSPQIFIGEEIRDTALTPFIGASFGMGG